MNIECMYDPIMQEDIEKVVNSTCPLEELKNANILVTGATGLIGSQVVKTLCAANRVKGLGITAYVLVRSKEKAEKFCHEHNKDTYNYLQNCDDNYETPSNYILFEVVEIEVIEDE